MESISNKYKVTRIEDGKTFEVNIYKFLTFSEDGRGKELIDNPKVGSSLMLPPFNVFHQWMTSVITEVIDNYNFKTENSTYKIEKI